MATRSAIGYIRPDGSIRAVYCHWDGSPGHQLPILTEHGELATAPTLQDAKRLAADFLLLDHAV